MRGLASIEKLQIATAFYLQQTKQEFHLNFALCRFWRGGGVHMMYTITRGPSKLVTQRRTGPTQQIDNKINDLKFKPTSWLASNSPPPKIVFNRLNGKRYHTPATQRTETPAESFTPAHEENVRFVYEAWQEVEQRLGHSNGESSAGQGPIQYTEKNPSPVMKNFVPIDLEEWWAQRFLANIANLS